MINLEEIKKKVKELNLDEKKEVLAYLREFIHIHSLEEEWNISAEIILEAISKSSDLTQRGVRGIITEATFKIGILDKLSEFEIEEIEGDKSFDYKIKDDKGSLSIQVKMQRKKEQRPMMANEGYRILSADKFVVETQRTRGGNDPTTNEDTRPYKFGEFDILAVAMEPSTNDWYSFMYTVSNWLLPRRDNDSQILKFQPVPAVPDEDWTSDLQECIDWYRSKKKKTISM